MDALRSVRTAGWLVVAMALLATLAAVVPYDRPGTALAHDDALTVGGIVTLGQSFAAEGEQLSGVRLYFEPDPATPRLPLTARVRYAAGPPVDLTSATVTLDLTRAQEVTLRFPPMLARPQPGVVTSTLLLELDLPALPPSSGPRIGVSRAGYAGGRAFIDGAPADELDLAFTPLYRRSLLDLVWPVSAIAAARPGILGLPPLYPLLAGAFLIALGLAVERVIAAGRADS